MTLKSTDSTAAGDPNVYGDTPPQMDRSVFSYDAAGRALTAVKTVDSGDVSDTLRRECLDHMIILNEKHLYDILHEYIFEYYNVSRTHMSLGKDSPVHHPTQANGKIISKSILGGLHHVYSRVA